MPRNLKEALAAVPVPQRERAREAIDRFGLPRQQWVYMPREEIHAIVIRLGGFVRAAQYFGVQNSTITKWRNAGRIPVWARDLYQVMSTNSTP